MFVVTGDLLGGDVQSESVGERLVIYVQSEDVDGFEAAGWIIGEPVEVEP